MNKKRIWLTVPAIIFPYLILASLAIIVFSTQNAIATYIMEDILGGNALLLVFAILIYAVIALLLSVVCFILGIFKNWDALSLAKTTMIIKLVQIPAYIHIFVFGVAFLITPFTAPFTFALFVFDYLTLVMTGLFCSAAVMVAIRQKLIQFKDYFWIILLQFFFCCDVVAAIIFYFKLKKSVTAFSKSCTS